MKAYRLQANVSQWLAEMARRAAHLETRSLSSYVASLIKNDLRKKGLIDAFDRPVKQPPEQGLGQSSQPHQRLHRDA